MDPPIPEYQCAILIIKWEIGDLNGAGATVDGRRQPVHRTIVGDQHISIVSNIKISINTVKDRTVDNKCYSPSRQLKTTSCLNGKTLLILQDYVRKPHCVVRDTDDFNAVIFSWLPDKAIIQPLLSMTFERKATSDKHSQLVGKID